MESSACVANQPAGVEMTVASSRRPRASVIIPTCDRGSILAETLRRLGAQTAAHADYEVIVVDHGSADDTAAITADAEARLGCAVRYVHLAGSEGFCPSLPRNRGLAMARGSIAILLDVDVLVDTGFIAAHLNAHAAEPTPQAVLGLTYGFPEDALDRTPEALRPPPKEHMLEALPALLAADPRWGDCREELYAITDDLRADPIPWGLFWTNNVSVPRQLAIDVGAFDEAIVGWGGEDIDLGFRLARAGARYRLCRQAWGVHYPHPIAPNTRDEEAGAPVRRYLVRKHQDLELELFFALFDDARAACPMLPLLREVPEPDAAGLGALQRAMAAHEQAWGTRVLWCGPSADAVAASLSIAASCRPCAPAPLDQGADHLRALGAMLPWPDAAFSLAIAYDYWRWLPDVVVARVVRELSRVAGQTLFVAGSTASAAPATAHPMSWDRLAGLAHVHRVNTPGLDAALVSPR